MIAFLTNYWWIFAIIIVAVIFVISIIKDKNNAKKWLLYAVAMAEKELGSGTGALKLQQVYDKFIEKFPIAAHFVSFETFKGWVDNALDSLEDLIDGNKDIKDAIEK